MKTNVQTCRQWIKKAHSRDCGGNDDSVYKKLTPLGRRLFTVPRAVCCCCICVLFIINQSFIRHFYPKPQCVLRHAIHEQVLMTTAGSATGLCIFVPKECVCCSEVGHQRITCVEPDQHSSDGGPPTLRHTACRSGGRDRGEEASMNTCDWLQSRLEPLLIQTDSKLSQRISVMHVHVRLHRHTHTHTHTHTRTLKHTHIHTNTYTHIHSTVY